jgi:hypothetical protein
MRNVLLASLLLAITGSFALSIPAWVTQASRPEPNSSPVEASRKTQPPTRFSQNSFRQTMIVTQPLTLQIRQEDPRFTAPGTPAGRERFLGHAALSFTLENQQKQPVIVELQTIEIRAVGHEKPLMSLPARTLTLQPLEIAPQRYQLSNREGFGKITEVEAVVIYEVDGQKVTLRSKPVTAPHNQTETNPATRLWRLENRRSR